MTKYRNKFLDMDEVRMDLGGPEYIKFRDDIYGVDKNLLDSPGPSVVSINGLIASYAVTEFMVGVTNIRKPVTLATYRGDVAKVLVNTDSPEEDCYYCNNIRGKKEKADIEKYVRGNVGDWL